MRFLFTCGGTAGHINPAIGVAGKLKELCPDAEFLFVGADGHMETELVPREGYEIKTVQVSNLRRGFKPKDIVHNVKSAANVVISTSQAKKILKAFKPDAAIGTGGYVCYPVLKSAAKLGIPTAVHESNAVPGLTTKMLADRVDSIMVGFEESRAHYKHPEKISVTGTPVRGDFLKYTRESARKELGLGNEPLVLSFWGSLGAAKMNEVMADFIKLNGEKHAFRHVHATGGGDAGLKKMLDLLDDRGVEKTGDTDVRPYIYDMPLLMAAADVILCRAGASTLAELAVIGKPAVLVPSPYVTNNHQEKNASVLRDRGGALMLREQEISGEKLFETVAALVSDKARLAEMSRAMLTLGNPDATEVIAQNIVSIIKKK